MLAYGRILSVLLVVLSGVALIGQLFQIRGFQAPLLEFPPMSIGAATIVMLLGLALWGFLHGARRAAAGVACLTALAGLLLMARMLMVRPTGPFPSSGLSGVTVFILSIGAVALATAALRITRQLQSLIITTAALLLVALPVTLLFARVARVLDTTGIGAMAGASVQTLATAFLLGGFFLAYVSEGLPMTDPPAWLPWAFALASLTTVTFLWRALVAQQDQQIRTHAREAAEAESRILRRELRATARALRRSAMWAASGASPEQERRDLASLVKDLTVLQAAFRLDGSGQVVLAVPDDLSPERAAWAARAYQGIPLEVLRTINYVPLDLDPTHFGLLAPICDQTACQGAIASVIDGTKLLQEVLSDSTPGWRFAVARPALPAGTVSLPDSEWRQEVPFELGTVQWSLYAWPTDRTLSSLRTNLPAAVLFAGLVVTLLIPLTVRQALLARRNAQIMERARLSLALEGATDGIWEWDVETGTTARSQGLLSRLQYDPAGIAPDIRSWLALIHPDDRPRVEAALQAHVAGVTRSFEAEYRFLGADDRWHIVVDRGRAVERHPNGDAIRVLGITADVTESRTIAAAREESERRVRAIFDSGYQFQLLLDRDGRVLEVNRAALEQAHETATTVQGQPCWDVLWWRTSEGSARKLKNAVEAAATGTTGHYEEEMLDRAGVPMVLEVTVKPILDVGGRPTQVLVEARDLTARRRAEAALQEVDTLTTMGRVAARVAHEINNPLAGIQNAFLLIKDAVPVDHPHHSYVGAIEREIGRIAAVTRQLYETYRPEQEVSRDSSVPTVIGDAVAFLEQVNRASRVHIRMDMGTDTMVPVPAAMLRQVVYNLVQNAVDASPPEGQVTVRTRCHDGMLEIVVRDQGPGVPVEHREKIFEPFFSTKDKRIRTGGMGLGLALVRRTVSAAGGQITVRDAEGGGSEFIVRLPLGQAREVRV
jgi:PAS domain S-box-containing protein